MKSNKHIKLFESFKSKSDVEYFISIMEEELMDVFEIEFSHRIFELKDGGYLFSIGNVGELSDDVGNVPDYMFHWHSDEYQKLEKTIRKNLDATLGNSWEFTIEFDKESEMDEEYYFLINFIDFKSIDDVVKKFKVDDYESERVYSFDGVTIFKVKSETANGYKQGEYDQHEFSYTLVQLGTKGIVPEYHLSKLIQKYISQNFDIDIDSVYDYIDENDDYEDAEQF